MRKKLLLIVVYTVMINLTGCTDRYAEVNAAAQKDIKSFSEGNMEEINRILFGTSECAADPETDMYEDNQTEGYTGILRIIFSHSTMSVKKVDKDRIEFEISSPNMENVFKYLPDTDNGYAGTERGFLEYLEDYVTVAELKKSTVFVPYSRERGNIVIDYYSEDFIRALTGGLTDAYNQLYMDVLEEYEKGVW